MLVALNIEGNKDIPVAYLEFEGGNLLGGMSRAAGVLSEFNLPATIDVIEIDGPASLQELIQWCKGDESISAGPAGDKRYVVTNSHSAQDGELPDWLQHVLFTWDTEQLAA